MGKRDGSYRLIGGRKGVCQLITAPYDILYILDEDTRHINATFIFF